MANVLTFSALSPHAAAPWVSAAAATPLTESCSWERLEQSLEPRIAAVEDILGKIWKLNIYINSLFKTSFHIV